MPPPRLGLEEREDPLGLREFVKNNRNILRLFQFGVVAFLLVVLMHVVSRGVFYEVILKGEAGNEEGVATEGSGSGEDSGAASLLKKNMRAKSLAGLSMLEAVKGSTILCFGDSLTRGLYVTESGEWRNTHPYAIRLNQLLKNESTAVAAGINGELTKDMVERLPQELQKNPSTRVAIILGGTNDLGHRKSVQSVLDNLVKLHSISLNTTQTDPDRPTFTVAVTIPQARWPFDPQHRLDINAGIRAFAKTESCRVALLDIESYRNQSVAANARYWSPDFVHFSQEGYDEIGTLLFEKMGEFLLRDNCG